MLVVLAVPSLVPIPVPSFTATHKNIAFVIVSTTGSYFLYWESQSFDLAASLFVANAQVPPVITFFCRKLI